MQQNPVLRGKMARLEDATAMAGVASLEQT
jgi:hypothetical protein